MIWRGGGSFGSYGGLIGDELAHMVVSCVANVADTDPELIGLVKPGYENIKILDPEKIVVMQIRIHPV